MTPFYQQGGITIYCGDCLEILPKIGKGFGLLTDPPYGLGKKWSGGTWFTRGVYEKEDMEWDSVTNQEAVDIALSISESAIVWGGNYYELPVSRCWLSWNKNPFPTMADFELAWTNLDMPSKSFNHRRNGWQRVHPTEKPIALLNWSLSFLKDRIILDPFMGGGTSLVAAQNDGREAVGIDISEEYCQKAVQRLKQRSLFVASRTANKVLQRDQNCAEQISLL